MTKRTILTGLGTYIDKKGVSQFGFQGQEVDVNDDYLEEFDEHNVENGDGKQVTYERIGVDPIGGPPVKKAEEEPKKEEEPKVATSAKKAT